MFEFMRKLAKVAYILFAWALITVGVLWALILGIVFLVHVPSTGAIITLSTTAGQITGGAIWVLLGGAVLHLVSLLGKRGGA
jgi:hypothetical protein